MSYDIYIQYTLNCKTNVWNDCIPHTWHETLFAYKAVEKQLNFANRSMHSKKKNVIILDKTCHVIMIATLYLRQPYI